jgi:hypothetical protein
MEKHRIWVTTSLKSANSLLAEKNKDKKINEEKLGFHLATLPYRLNGRGL